jgi:hypothetical protein
MKTILFFRLWPFYGLMIRLKTSGPIFSNCKNVWTVPDNRTARELSLLTLLTCIVTAPAMSQGWRIAPTVGLNVSAITYSSAFRNAMNSGSTSTSTGLLVKLQVGALLDYAFSDRFSIRSGLLYTGKGGRIRSTGSQYGIIETARARIELSYVEIPLLLNIAVGNNGFRLMGGPILGVTLSGKSVVEAGNYYGYGYFGGSTTNFKIGSDPTSSILPIDLSVSLGLVKEMDIGNRPFEIGLHVQPSFSNWNTTSKTQPANYARNLLVGLRIAYLFELRR